MAVNVMIVDDLAFYDQPFFEDGALAQKVSTLVQSGNVVYISAAGNDAQLHYQNTFLASPTGNYHDFDPGAPTSNALIVATTTAGTTTTTTGTTTARAATPTLRPSA